MCSRNLLKPSCNFYSRPCGRGDAGVVIVRVAVAVISTHAPAGGATKARFSLDEPVEQFLLTPLREGRPC